MILSQMQDALQKSANKLAMAQCEDIGKPIRYCFSEIDRCLLQIENAKNFSRKRGERRVRLLD